MQEYLKLHENVKYVLVYKLDRISRRLVDQLLLLQDLDETGVRLISATENIDATPAGKLQRSILGAFAEYDNEVRGERCLNGSIERFKQGLWVHTPPPGYFMQRDSITKRSMAIPNPKQAPHITWAFQQRAKGVSFEEIAQGMNARGYRTRNGKQVKASDVERIIKKTFYMGLMTSFKGMQVEGRHKPLISKEVWYRAQAVNAERSRDNKNRSLFNPTFPLRGFVKCTNCQRKLTASAPKGRTKRYEYYHHGAHRCEVSRNVAKIDLELKFKHKLGKFEPNPEYLPIVKAAILDQWQERLEVHTSEQTDLAKQISKLKSEKSTLMEMKRQNQNLYTDEEFIEQKQEIDKKIALLQSDRNDDEKAEKDFDKVVELAFSYLKDPVGSWERIGEDKKQRFQAKVFPQGLEFDGNDFGTAETSLLMRLMELAATKKAPSKKRLSQIVDMARIELACET